MLEGARRYGAPRWVAARLAKGGGGCKSQRALPPVIPDQVRDDEFTLIASCGMCRQPGTARYGP